MMKKMALTLLVVVSAQLVLAKSVGLWKDLRSHITDGMIQTLNDAGWETTILEKNDLSNEEKLSALDVVFLPGGWNGYYFADFHARRALVKFAAGGKGLLAGAFRSGWVRTANRPFFPEVGATHNRVNGAYVWAHGDSALAKAIDKPFCPGGWDHLVVKVGPNGKVFAVNGEDPVGVYGDVYGGRYLIFGAFIGMDAKTEPMTGVGRSALLAMLDWLSSAPALPEAERVKYQAQAEIDFLRREMLYDWTLSERGPDRSFGVLPTIHARLVLPLESRLYTLQYVEGFLDDTQRKGCAKAIAALESALNDLEKSYQKELAAKRAQIERMNFDELVAENPFIQGVDLTERVSAVSGKTEKAVAGAVAALKRPSTYACKELALFLYDDAIREKLLPQKELDKLAVAADEAIASFKLLVAAAKQARAAEERKADLATTPELIAASSSNDAETRRAAVVELGRIGDPKSVPTLIKLLGDPEEQIRVNAIIALGWMQSSQAVPELMKVAAGTDLRMQTRAIQALGQIGDPRAAKTVLAHIRDKSPFVAENAIISAGWLKAREAVPELVKIVLESDPNIGEQRLLMYAALRALGHIGDTTVLPQLEELVASTNDYPKSRSSGMRDPIANIYATPQGLGLKRYSEIAVAEIQAGGRKALGVRQADFLASKENFYALQKNFNALAGRAESILLSPGFAETGLSALPHLVDAGFTGVHNAWGSQDTDPDLYFNLVHAAGELGLHWIDVLPVNAFPYRAPYYGNNAQSGVEKAAADLVLSKFQDEPAFTGFWSEETYPGIKATVADFEAWLVGEYGQDYRTRLGWSGDVVLPATSKEFHDILNEVVHPLKTAVLEFGADRIVEYWRETQEWLTSTRKGCAFTFSVSGTHFASYIGLTGPVGDAIAVNGPESYQGFGRDNAFYMEMYKDGARRPVMCEFYNWYTPSPAHEIRGFAQHLMHGECFYNFALAHIFTHVSGDNWNWANTRWENASKIFRKARKIGEYIAVPESAANVAQLCSEATACHYNEHSSLGGRWYQQQTALWVALQQSHIPADIIWAETLTPEKLARYRVVLMSDAKMLSEAQAGMVRDWVTSGGVLIATGASTLCDRLPTPRQNYLLADVFGADYIGFAGTTDPARNTTMRFKHGSLPAPVASTMDLPDVRNHIMRDIKPLASLGTFTVSGSTEKLLPGVATGIACEYDMPLGYDKVTLSTAEVLAKFSNGDTALAVNKIGNGLCYFWTPLYPGLCHTTSEWEMQPNTYTFWPNIRELLDGMVRGGLAHQGATLPVDVSNVEQGVEVTLRQQPEFNRMMVHLLNYDTKVDLVKGPTLTIHPPAGKTVARVFYPDTDTEITFISSETGVTAALRDLSVHDMVVIEWSR